MITTGKNVVLSDDALLGERVEIGNNVTIYSGVTLGDRCRVFDGAVLGRPPLTTGNTTRPLDARQQGLTIGADCIIGANAVIYTGSQIGQKVLIGDLASIREGCVLADQVVIGRGVMVMYDTRVGERTRVIDGAILTGNMVIEADVFIGPGVNTINDNDVYLKRFGLIPFESQGPTIRRFALLGASASLNAGIEVGMGAIVAPGSVVIRDVPAWTVVGGHPSEPIRNIQPEVRAQILAHFGLSVDAETVAQ